MRFFAALAVAAFAMATDLAEAASAYHVVHYEVHVEPRIDTRSVTGAERIDFVADAPGVLQLEFEAGALDVREVRIDDDPAEFSKEGSRLVVRPSRPLPEGRTLSIHLQYAGQPKYGLEFSAQPPQVYTIFSTSQWMVCLDEPAARATLDLSVLLPAGFLATGSGVALAPEAQADGRMLFRWRQDAPVPSFTYGFAGGPWRQVRGTQDGLALRFLSAGKDETQLQRVFSDTAHAVHFMTQKAGRSMQSPSYEQVLVASTIGQEAAGFALLSEDYGDRVLADPSAAGLIAHELAHQWWGVAITCTDWGHFWLNEGMATFMAAAWLGDRFGPDAYARAVAGWKTRVARLEAEGKDHALVYASWKRPSADDRAVVYTRGAYVLHLLREELGDEAFWAGIRLYTRRNWERSVTTADFQAAVEEASGRDLHAFFDKQVYARP